MSLDLLKDWIYNIKYIWLCVVLKGYCKKKKIQLSSLWVHLVKITHLSPPPVCPGVSPARWRCGGRSICRLHCLWPSGCLLTGPTSWRTLQTWTADYSSRETGLPLCCSLSAMTVLCTGIYWLNRWGGGLHPLWPPPAALHRSLQGHLMETQSREIHGLVGKKK